MNSYLTAFGHHCRSARNSRGLTIADQAKLMGIGPAKIQALENESASSLREEYLVQFGSLLKLSTGEMDELRSAALDSRTLCIIPGLTEPQSQFLWRTLKELSVFKPALIAGLPSYVEKGVARHA